MTSVFFLSTENVYNNHESVLFCINQNYESAPFSLKISKINLFVKLNKEFSEKN